MSALESCRPAPQLQVPLGCTPPQPSMLAARGPRFLGPSCFVRSRRASPCERQHTNRRPAGTDPSCLSEPALQLTPFKVKPAEVLPESIGVVRYALSFARSVE